MFGQPSQPQIAPDPRAATAGPGMSENVFARMDAAMDAASDCDEPAALVAGRLVDQLQREDPELLAKWLDRVAVTVVRDAIQRRDASRRARARRTMPASVFAQAAADGALGDLLNVRYTADAAGARKQLGAMTRRDLEFCITHLRTTQDRLEVEARFLERIMSKLGDNDTVASVLTANQVASLRVAL